MKLFTRAHTRALGKAGQERAAERLAAHIKAAGDPQPTKETRQNRRMFERQARKMYGRKVAHHGLRT